MNVFTFNKKCLFLFLQYTLTFCLIKQDYIAYSNFIQLKLYSDNQMMILPINIALSYTWFTKNSLIDFSLPNKSINSSSIIVEGNQYDALIYGFVGLGSTAVATMECLLPLLHDRPVICKLLRYKQQAETFAGRFVAHKNVTFQIVDTPEELVIDTDVLVSAVTEMPQLFCADDTLYKPGMLLVPIHTRGFQNCDLFFDRIVADDRGHVCGFKYFDRFRSFNELSELLLGKVVVRQSDNERIIAYNIGLGLHDIYYANKIYERLTC